MEEKDNWFRYFLRKNFSMIGNSMSNEDCDAVGEDFMAYLEIKVSDEVRNKIIPKNNVEVILNMDNPLKMHGFNPALYLHFEEFLKASI